MMEQYDLTLMFIRLSSNGFSDEPHPRFLVQGHHILSFVGGDALLFPHHFTPHPTEHQLCTLGTYGQLPVSIDHHPCGDT